MRIIPDSGAPSPLGEKAIAAEQRQVKAETSITSMTVHPGHTMFEFDLTTGEVSVAKVERVDARVVEKTQLGLVNTICKKVIQRPQCLYASALNAKNAIKKFSRMYERLVKAGKVIRPNQQQT